MAKKKASPKRKRRARKTATAKAAKSRSPRVPSSIPARIIETLRMVPGYDPFRETKGYHYDVEAGELAVNFFERILTHVKGPLGGQPFLLERWQKAIVMNLWGWRTEDGARRYHRFFIYVPKKNGKTQMAAGLILLMLATDHEPGAEIVGAAAAKEQAAYIFEQAVGMVRQSPILAKRLRVYGGRGGAVQKRICNEPEASIYKLVAADADTFDGGNVHGGIIDELHRQDDPEFPDLLESSTAARKNHLIGSITTADFWRPESPCNIRYEYACQVRDGIIPDAQFLPVIYEATKDDDFWSEETWKKANPNYGVSVAPEQFRRLAEKAQREPSFRNKFLRLHLNFRTDTREAWIPGESWAQCGPDTVDVAIRDEILARFSRSPCWIGLDLSSKIDLTCVHMIFPEEIDDIWHHWSVPWFFAPRERAIEREKTDHVPYVAWADAGWLTLTPGNVIDYGYVERHVLDTLGKQYEIREVAYDPWSAMQLALNLQAEGMAVVEVRQGYGSISEPAKAWEAAIVAKTWHHDGNPVMTWCVANAAKAEDPAGNIKYDKQHSTGRIDGVASLVTGLARAMIQADSMPTATQGIYVL